MSEIKHIDGQTDGHNLP